MSKEITSNARTDDVFTMLHLFEFSMDKNWDYDQTDSGEVLRFTDHDVFVDDGTNEYTPIAITWDKLTEDFSMQSDNINITIDNINGELSAEGLANEWRNNPCKIRRVIYTPSAETIDGNTYEFGFNNQSTTTYPKLSLSGITQDNYLLFEGVIDSFSANEQTLSATLNTQFVHWSKPYPARTYNQNEFTTIVDAINDVVYWGQQKIT